MKNVFITGANRGIGFEIVKALLKENYSVIALSKNIDQLEQIKNDKLLMFEVNLLNPAHIEEVFDKLQEKKICIDILINNVGKGIFRKIEELTIDEWNEVLQLNLTVPYYLMHKTVLSMKKRGYGRIINIGSDADHIPYAEAGAYCASKYGLLGLTESVRLELKMFNVNITTLSPGRVDTYFNEKTPGCRPNALKPEDIAKQVVFVLKQDDRCIIEQIKLSSSLE